MECSTARAVEINRSKNHVLGFKGCFGFALVACKLPGTKVHLTIDVFDSSDSGLHCHVSTACDRVGKVNDIAHSLAHSLLLRLLNDIYLVLFKRLPRTLSRNLRDNLTPVAFLSRLIVPIGDLT